MYVFMFICIATPLRQHFTTAERVLRKQWIRTSFEDVQRPTCRPGARILPDSQKLSGQQLFQCFRERCFFVRCIFFSQLKTLKELQGPVLWSLICFNFLGTTVSLRTCRFSSKFPGSRCCPARILRSSLFRNISTSFNFSIPDIFPRFSRDFWLQDSAAGVVSYPLPMDDWTSRCFRSLEILGTGCSPAVREAVDILWSFAERIYIQ